MARTLEFTLEQLKNMAVGLPKHIQARLAVPEENPINSCWEFNGVASSNGYMRCWYNGHRHMAHRLFYELVSGKDIRHLQLDHLCVNRICCNPNHMDPVTGKTNCKRRTRRRKKV
jgi:hypothetical protein